MIEQGAPVVVQGATGREARMVVRHMLAYGTAVVAGVTPGRGGEEVEGVPVYDTVSTTVWKSLKMAGIDTGRVKGWGRIFAL